MTTFNVASAAQLRSALSASKAGDAIMLAQGNYGALVVNGFQDARYKFGSPVTIASADPDRPAVFDQLDLAGVKNVILDGLSFDLVTTASTSAAEMPFRVDGSSDVTIRNASFDGDVFKGVSAAEAGFATGLGLLVARSQGVTVEKSEFFGFKEGAMLAKVSDLVIRDNGFHGMSGDAIKFSEITGGVIEGNRIGDFSSSAASDFHMDMIQFLTAGTDVPSSDIVIRGNVLNSGAGDWTQSIFMGNEAVTREGAGQEMFFRNILIEDNVIYNTHLHGIAVYAANGLTIRNNTVLRNSAAGDENSGVYIPAISVSDIRRRT